MRKKEYGLIPEAKAGESVTPILRAGDMQRGSNTASWPRIFFFSFLLVPLGLISPGLIIYKVFFAISSPSLWINIPFVIACVYMFWLFLRWCISIYVQVRSKTNQLYQWRPAGLHLVMLSQGPRGERGKLTCHCPHCREGSHSFMVSVRRENFGGITYIPTFFDPLSPTKIEYNRNLSLPVSCPQTARTLDGKFNVKQTSHNPVIEIKVIGPAA